MQVGSHLNLLGLFSLSSFFPDERYLSESSSLSSFLSHSGLFPFMSASQRPLLHLTKPLIKCPQKVEMFSFAQAIILFIKVVFFTVLLQYIELGYLH